MIEKYFAVLLRALLNAASFISVHVYCEGSELHIDKRIAVVLNFYYLKL